MARFILDGFLLDRGFQPVADQLETRDISIFNIARFFSDGAVITFVANFLMFVFRIKLTNLESIILVIILLTGYSVVGRINRNLISFAERETKPGMGNPGRFTLHPMRLICLGFSIMEAAKLVFDPTLDHMLTFVAWMLWMLGIYFASCFRRPKMRQTSKIEKTFLGRPV